METGAADMAKQFSLEWTAGAADQDTMLREFLKKNEISKTALTEIKFKGGFISVNGLEVNVRYFLKTGDMVKVDFPEIGRASCRERV